MAEAAQTLSRSLSARTLLAPSPEIAYALRLGIAVSAAIWIGWAPGLVESHSTWILITVLMLVQPTTGASLQKAILRAAGTLVAALTAIALFGLFAQDPPLLMSALFLTQMVGAYGFSGTRFQYAYFVFAFTTAIVLGDAMAGKSAVEVVAFERASMVGIGVLLAFVVDSLVWPSKAESQLRESLMARARLLGGAVRRAVATLEDTRDGDPAASAPASLSLGTQLGLVGPARSELGNSRTNVDALARMAVLLEALASRERVLAAPIEVPSGLDEEGQAFMAALSELARRIELALGETAAALAASSEPSPFSEDLESALLALEGERDRLVQRIGWSEGFEGWAASLHDLVALLGEIEATLSSPSVSSEEGRSSGLPGFAPDPFRMKIALRGGVGVVAAFLAPMALGWPINTIVAPVAFMTAVLTRGAAMQTVSSLVASVALAWAVADVLIVYVAPYQGRAPLALMVPFAVAAAFAYIASKQPKLAPLASMGGLVVFLSVYGGMSKPMNVYGPYSTVSYIALALGIGVLVGRIMWPATAAGLYRQRVAAQLTLCLDAVRRARESGEAEQARDSAQLVQSFATQSAQLGTLHRQALLEPVEGALDPTRRVRILSLATDLLDAVVAHHPGSLEALLDRGGERFRPLQAAIRRGDESLVESMKAVTMALRGEASQRASGLADAHQAVAGCLAALRAEPIPQRGLSDEEVRQVLVLLDSRRRLVFRQREVEGWLDEWRAAEAGCA